MNLDGHFQENGSAVPIAEKPVAQSEIIQRLRSVPFLQNFSEDAIYEIALITTEKTFPGRSVVFREGDRGDALYIIKSGRATIGKRNRLDVDVIIATLSDGAIVGDMALIDQQPRSATLSTVTPTTFYIIQEVDFQQLLYNNREVTRGTLVLLTDRIRRSNERLIDFALDNHPDMVLLTDTDFRITDVNKQAQSLLKIHPNEELEPGVMGKLGILLEKVRNQTNERKPFFMILMKPEKLFLWVHVNPLKNSQGYLQGYLIELRDITQARDTSRRSLEIASFIIHRLPNLIEKMRGADISEEPAQDLSSDYVACVREVNRQVNKLVAFTDLEAGPLRIQRSKVNPDEIATGVINSLQYVMAMKHQSFELHLDFGAGNILADGDWLRKLLTILISNAVTYSADGSVIVVQTSQLIPGTLRCRIQNPTDFVISEEASRRYFDITTQLEDFEALRSADFGLELPLASHIIEAHNGRISVEPNLQNLFSVVFEIG
ncbi:MAG: cyclic nucleotide-binding domain-containing protein [Candidatus Ozemobacteraceae bacterium]